MQKLKERERRGRVHLGVLVDPEQQQRLAALARLEDRSVSSVTRAAINAYLEREEPAGEAGRNA